MNEPIFSMLTGKQCGTRTAQCGFVDFSYRWAFTSEFPSACSDCESGWTSAVTPEGIGAGNISDACGGCSSSNDGAICTIDYYCN